MPKRLRDIRLSEISLVDRPANPGARVALWKRHEDAGTGSPPAGSTDAAGDGTNGVTDMPDKAPDTRVAELEAALEKSKSANEALKLDLEKAQAIASLSEAEAAFMKGLEDGQRDEFALMSEKDRKRMMDDEEKRKAADPVTKALEEQRAELAKAQAETAELKKQLEAREFAKRAETELDAMPGEAMAKGEALRIVEQAGNEALKAMLKAGNEACRQLTKERGVAGSPDDTAASDEVAKRIAELRKTNASLSDEAAKSELFKSDTDLRNRYIAETRAA